MGELEPLIEPEWLEKRLNDPEVRIVDASWYLPDAGRDARAEYAEAHLPGALYLDLSTDLADPEAPVRNTVASPDRLAAVFSASGIGPDHRVVVYDRLGGYSAGRVWWTLRYAGHRHVALLNGGFPRWVEEGRPVTAEVPDAARAKFVTRLEPRWLRTLDQMLEVVRQGGATIVDVRSADRYRGEGPESTRYRGHIPGAINVPYRENLAQGPPVLREPGELRSAYSNAGVRFDRPVITTCGSGVTASLAAFVLTTLGHPEVSVYDGSWAEWGNREGLPVERGDPRRESTGAP